MKANEELATRLAFQRMEAETHLRPQPVLILGAYNVGQEEILHHRCEQHNVFLIGLAAWEMYQASMPSIRLSPSGLAMLHSAEVQPFEHVKHGELIKAVMRCGTLHKREPFKVYNV